MKRKQHRQETGRRVLQGKVTSEEVAKERFGDVSSGK
jgi:hypothetical protein